MKILKQVNNKRIKYRGGRRKIIRLHMIYQTEEAENPYVPESSHLWIGNSKKHIRKGQIHLSGSFL